MEHKSDIQIIKETHNTARFFVEQRHVAWVLIIGTVLWGILGYWKMPQRKDPDIPVREAMAIVPWPGMSAEKVEQLVTRKVETTVAQNAKVAEIRSISRTGTAVIYMKLDERVSETGKEFDDIKLKLDGLRDLPDGAGPLNFVKDFGDTAALMLTVASPRVDDVDLDVRTRDIRQAIEQTRRGEAGRFSVVIAFPRTIDHAGPRRLTETARKYLAGQSGVEDLRIVEGRPLSKNKRWVLKEILRVAPITSTAAPAVVTK